MKQNNFSADFADTKTLKDKRSKARMTRAEKKAAKRAAKECSRNCPCRRK